MKPQLFITLSVQYSGPAPQSLLDANQPEARQWKASKPGHRESLTQHLQSAANDPRAVRLELLNEMHAAAAKAKVLRHMASEAAAMGYKQVADQLLLEAARCRATADHLARDAGVQISINFRHSPTGRQ